MQMIGSLSSFNACFFVGRRVEGVFASVDGGLFFCACKNLRRNEWNFSGS